MVYCPKHGKGGAVLALDYHENDPMQSRLWTKNEEYICPVCYPGIVAELVIVKNKRVEKIADKSAQATARLLARAKDEIYTVVFPEHREEIEETVKERHVLKRNWDGRHESIDFLKQENHIIQNFANRAITPEEFGIKAVKQKVVKKKKEGK